MKKGKKIQVICAMSGGVDSSVSAALLKRSGFEVVGAFMRLLDGGRESELRARVVARQLGIPFHVLDLRKEFKKLIIDRFIADTKKGLTPNPCVVCNQEIKFGLLIEKALGTGVDHIATGHYCRIKKTKDEVYHLLKGKDKNKDQSYFLWCLGQRQLSRIIFPIGEFTKSEVKQLAKNWKLPAIDSTESQEACFVAGDMNGFLEKRCGKNPGNIIDISGNVLGRHRGLWFYTIGQRKGIKLSGGPYYVVSKNFIKNELVVTRLLNKLGLTKIKLRDVKWVSDNIPELPLTVKARIRYRAKEANAIIRRQNRVYELEFTKPQFAPAPGQAAVFYRGNELLGGGTIKE